MDVEDSAREDSLSSLTINSSNSNRNENALSPDDLAWVDSCLLYDLEDSDNNMNFLREALLEIINHQPESLISSLTGTSFSHEEGDMDVLPSNEKGETKEFLQLPDEDLVPTYEEAEAMSSSFLNEEEGDILSLLAFEGDFSGNSLQDAILLNHEDSSKKVNETHDSLHDINVSAEAERVEDNSVINEAGILSSKVFKENLSETSRQDSVMSGDRDGYKRVSEASDSEIFNYSIDEEMSIQDIFRVWDLEIPSDDDEEDELEQQLNKALNETSRQSLPPTSGDSVALEDSSIDDLIAGISDLSLNLDFT